jgi:hypothetical protein
MNYAVVIAPKFALQALRRSGATLATRPFAIAEDEGRNARITEASEHATGVESGLAVSKANRSPP